MENPSTENATSSAEDGIARLREGIAVPPVVAARIADDVQREIAAGVKSGIEAAAIYCERTLAGNHPSLAHAYRHAATNIRAFADFNAAPQEIATTQPSAEGPAEANRPAGAAPRSSYKPLTVEQIENIRSTFNAELPAMKAKYPGEVAAEAHRVYDALCSMAVNSLLYAEEIQRLRSAS